MNVEECWDIINDYLARQWLPYHVDLAVKRINIELEAREYGEEEGAAEAPTFLPLAGRGDA